MKKFIEISVCAAFCFILHVPVQGQLSKPIHLIDLSGKWKLNTGETVFIAQSGNNVTAVFLPPVKCHNEERRTLFNSPIQFTSLTGRDTIILLGSDEFWSCTRDKKLIDDCGLTPIYVTKFRAEVSPDGSMINGERFAEGWAYDEKDGKYVNCHRDSKYDAWINFTLTRVDRNCDDLKFAWAQKKLLLNAHDAQMSAIAKQYNDLYDQYVGKLGDANRLIANAQAEWDLFTWNKWMEANFTIPTAELPPLAIITLPFTAIQEIIGFYQYYQAYHGSIDDVRAWARQQPMALVADLLRLLNYLDDMGSLAARMATLKNTYDIMQVERERLEKETNDAKRELDACLGNQ